MKLSKTLLSLCMSLGTVATNTEEYFVSFLYNKSASWGFIYYIADSVI